MRIGIVYTPRPQTWPKFQWVHEALLGLGHAVHHLQTLEELIAEDRKADLILFEHRQPMDQVSRKQIAATSIGRSAIWVQWWFDLLYEQTHQNLLEVYGQLMRSMDWVVVKERQFIDRYAAHGIKAVWGDQGCPRNIGEVEHEPHPAYDVVLFGTRMEEYWQRRSDVRVLLEHGFRVAWAGSSGDVPLGCADLPWCPPHQLPIFLSSGGLVLSVDLRSDVDGYVSDRFWLATGIGACVLHRGEGPKIPHVSYRNDLELVRLARHLQGDPEARKQIGQSARREVMREHTYERACERIFDAIGCGKQVHARQGGL